MKIYELTGIKFFDLVFSMIFLFVITLFPSIILAEINDRVVGFVDNEAITLSELEIRYETAQKITPDITREEVLNTMINRILLVREAKKIRLEAPSEDELLEEYIDLKIRAFIRIRDEEMMVFYEKNIEEFQGREFEAVREEIENYLIEKELNKRLKLHIQELKENACIKIQLEKEVE